MPRPGAPVVRMIPRETLEAARLEYPDFRPLRAFFALALHSAGRSEEALAELLNAIADEGDYERSLRAYASEL